MTEDDSSMNIRLKECPINPIPGAEMKRLLAKATYMEWGTDLSEDDVATGPTIIKALLVHNKEHASAIMWSLMNIAISILIQEAKVKKEKIQ